MASENPSPDWAMYNGDYAANRFSPLSDITPANVKNLRQICAYELPEKVMFESGIVAVGGTLYFTTFEHLYGPVPPSTPNPSQLVASSAQQ